MMKKILFLLLFALFTANLHAQRDQWSGERIAVSDFKKVPHGKGTMIYANGDKFEGEMDRGERAKGTFTKANGTVYRGTFFSDKYHGFGELWQGDKYYVGNFNVGVPHGPGTQTEKGSYTISGIFNEGKMSWGYVIEQDGTLKGIYNATDEE